MIIDLPFATESLNTLMAWKFHQGTRWKYRDHKRDMVNALRAFGGMLNQTTKPMRVTFTRYSAGELDDDNLRGGFKPLRDALKSVGLIVDDNSKWLEAHYRQVKTKRGDKRTRVEIEVLP